MAKRPPNQSGPVSGKIPAKKTTPKKASSKGSKTSKKATGLYSWNGGPATHTISQDQHAANMLGASAGLPPGTLSANLTDPLSTSGAYGLAQLLAKGQYQPQIDANQTLQRSVPAWFQSYQNDVQAGRNGPQGIQTLSAPVLASANQAVQNVQALPPGIDPNSPEYQRAVQAAQGRGSLAQLGADTLQSVATAGDNYLAGQQAVAARQLPQVQQDLVNQGAQLKGQYGSAVANNFNTLRTGEQNYGLAQATLASNVANQQADNAVAQQNANTQAQSVKNTAKNNAAKQKAAGQKPNQYGIPEAQWEKWSSSHRQRVIDAANKQKQKPSTDAANQKKMAAIQKATGGIQTQVQNALQDWKSYVGKETDDTTKPKDPKTGQYPPRLLNPDDIKSLLRAKGYDAGLIHVMLLVRVGKPLDQQAIDYLHHKDPNIRIPRSWLNGKPAAPTSRPGNAPGANGQQRPT
jgi:hypothetical protein